MFVCVLHRDTILTNKKSSDIYRPLLLYRIACVPPCGNGALERGVFMATLLQGLPNALSAILFSYADCERVGGKILNVVFAFIHGFKLE